MTAFVSFALTLIAERVVKGKTWAGDNIEREPINPLNTLLNPLKEDQNVPQRPLIAIYGDKTKTQPTDRDVSTDYAQVDLNFYVFVAPGRTRLPDDEDGNALYQFELDGEKANLTLPMIARQIENALRDPEDEWAALWKKFVLGYTEVSTIPILHEIEGGAKVPCMEIKYSIRAKANPDQGVVPPRWKSLIDMLSVSSEDQILGQLLESLILEDDTNVFDPEMRRFALTESAFIASGMAPVEGSTDPDTGEGATLTDVGVSVEELVIEQNVVPND